MGEDVIQDAHSETMNLGSKGMPEGRKFGYVIAYDEL